MTAMQACEPLPLDCQMSSPLPRHEAFQMTKQILDLAEQVAGSDQPDLRTRAANIAEIARTMIYDDACETRDGMSA